MGETIDNLRLTPCENGYVLSWTERCYPDRGSLCNCTYEEKTLVFKEEESKEAVAKLRELYNSNKDED